MGCNVSLDKCTFSVVLEENRKWTYSTDEPSRFIIEKYGGEWLGWFPSQTTIRVELFHTLGTPVLLQYQSWVRRENRWHQRSDVIYPELRSFTEFSGGETKFRAPGLYKMAIIVRTKENKVLSRTVTFQICHRENRDNP